MKEILEKLQSGDITFKEAYELVDKKENLTDMKIVRTYSAGVFAGYIVERISDKRLVLTNARRLWYWSGAASLSQLCVDGVKNPDECKFPVAVPVVELTEVVEILDVTEKAKQSIDSVPIWKA
jgi:hypothetical protein